MSELKLTNDFIFKKYLVNKEMKAYWKLFRSDSKDKNRKNRSTTRSRIRKRVNKW